MSRLPSAIRSIAVVLLVACMAQAKFERVSGRIRSGTDMQPVHGARIVGLQSGRAAWTDHTGRFELPAMGRTVVEFRQPPTVRGGTRLFLGGPGHSFWWVSPSGRSRLLAEAPVDLHPGRIGDDFGWVCVDPAGSATCWSILKVGRNVVVSGSGRTAGGGLLVDPPLPDTLSIWIPGRGFRQVSVVHGDNLELGIPPIRTVAGDFHTHTFLTDGSHTLDDVAAHAFGGTYSLRNFDGSPIRDSVPSGFGLDWFANSEHGGAFSSDRFGNSITASPQIQLKGIPTGGYMWRWQSLGEFSWPAVDSLRRFHPGRQLFQGVEWNVPGHEHASVGILASSPDPISRFEFLYDAGDGDTVGAGWPEASVKERVNSHAKALAGARWLRDHHGDSSWIVVNHPSRLRLTFIQDLRDLHEAGGPVFLGIEAIPGHHKASSRGLYGYTPPFPDDPWNARTWGGVDRMLARVGGVMDALWSEGRKVWVFANSDFHYSGANDHYPGEYNKNVTRVADKSAAGILAGLRSGATVATMGDLVDSFSLELDDGRNVASMGGELTTGSDSVTVLVRYHVPAHSALGDIPVVDHVDLIRGEVHGRILPGDGAYTLDTVANVSVVASVRTGDLVRSVDGWFETRWKLPADRSSYFRVRGSRLPRGTAGWTDSAGNPLCDETHYPNDASQALYNRWFYSNPVFLKRR
ncbi:MAG TPA: hypothetical protein PKO15_13190 [Fibrobacteria bacterium]|nr:hypothetical protein [Fibrobacteria bacterium]